jgi:hypothetical protein
LQQHPSPRPLRMTAGIAEPASVTPPAQLWQPEIDAGIRFGVWRLHPLVVTVSILLIFCAARLLLYWLLAHGFGGLSHTLCNYDCAWYEHTARAGYDLAPDGDRYADTANWAFFPLYPLLLAAASVLAPPDGMSLAGILLSTLCFLGFATAGAVYLQLTEQGAPDAAASAERGPFAVPLAWLCLISLWPGDLYFAFPYSEALYAVLMTASLLALTRRRPLESAAWSAALTATRLPGIMMTPVIVADGLGRLMRLHRSGRLRAAPVTVIGQTLLPIALAPLGLFAFMAYLRWHMGDGLAFVHVQSAWNRHAMMPWMVLWDGLAADDWGRILAHPARESLSLEAAFAVGGLILAGRQMLQRRYAEAWLIAATILLASSSGLQSMPRFVLTNPAVIFALYRLGTRAATPRRLILLGVALGLVHLLFVLAWFIGAPVLA